MFRVIIEQNRPYGGGWGGVMSAGGFATAEAAEQYCEDTIRGSRGEMRYRVEKVEENI